MVRYIAGVLTVIVFGGLLIFALVWSGHVPARADNPKASAMEKWAARTSLDATIAREAPQPPYPYGPVTDATIVAGAKLYMANCAVCHGSMGLYIPAPQFTKHGVDDDPEGETYWKIEHGIRFTGMPSFAGSLTEEQIWQITYFLKRGMDKLPSAADIIWHGTHGD